MDSFSMVAVQNWYHHGLKPWVKPCVCCLVLPIRKNKSAVIANSSNKLYGASRAFTGGEFIVTSGSLVNGNTLTNATLASVGASSTAPVGSYAITVTNATGAGASNYVISYLAGLLTVDPTSLVISAGSTAGRMMCNTV